MKKLFALFFIFIFFPGCATQGERSATPSTTFLFESQTLKSGKVRLTCGLSCSGTFGFNRRKLKRLHDTQNWEELASEVARIGFPQDQAYYYLGRSMEGSGSFDAAMVYYKLGLASKKCDGLFNNCDFVFPEEINNRMLALSKSNGFHKVKPNTLQPVLSSSSVVQQVVAEKVPEDERPKVEPRKQAEQVRRKQAELEAELAAAQQAQVRPVASVFGADKVGRVALVIGNAAYKSSPLANPVNDATDMAKSLRALGFDVVERTNITIKQIGRTLRAFRTKIKPGDVALVFYAGHGLQINGENYLPAVDADIVGEDDVPNQSLSTRQIMDVLADSKSSMNLVFLDACRDNPYARSFRSSTRGLSRENAPSGTLLSYATRPGSVAADGTGRNGLYTSLLLKAMEEKDQPIELLLKQVVSGVFQASNGSQEPWMEGSIRGNFCFGGCR
jgi:hypothetical protein